jgi:hypothetical protein
MEGFEMKITVGMPCGGEVRIETVISLLLAMRHADKAGHTLYFHPSVGSVPSGSQNTIFEHALAQDDDAVLLIDSDMQFPASTITRLAAHGKDVVGSPYRRRSDDHDLMLGVMEGEMIPTEQKGLVHVKWLPSGMLFVRRQVLETMGYPWMEEIYNSERKKMVGHDVNFCLKITKLGFQVWADFDLAREVFHVGTIALGLMEHRF